MENFYTSIKPFCVFSQIFGFFPLSFDGPPRKGIFKTKSINVLLVIVSQGTMITFAYRAIEVGINGSNENFFRARIWSWILICGFLMTLLHFLFQMTKLKKIVKFYHHIHLLDAKLYTIHAQVNHKKNKMFILAATLSLIMLPLLDFTSVSIAAYFLGSKFGFLWNLMYNIYLMCKVYLFVQFITAAYAVHERLKALNNSIT